MEAHRLAVLWQHDITLFNLNEDLNTVLQCPIQIGSLAIMGTWDSKPGRVGGLVFRAVSELLSYYAGNKGGVVPVWNGSLDCSFVLP